MKTIYDAKAVGTRFYSNKDEQNVLETLELIISQLILFF